MTDPVGNVVWILGAGFSRSLGGPLLTDLFTHERTERALVRMDLSGERRRQLNQLVKIYQRVQPSKAYWAPPWTDPETFVEFLEQAADDTQPWAAALLKRHLVDVPEANEPWLRRQMSRWARQYLAAVCHEFAADAQVAKTAERWSPYRRWAAEVVSRQHTVISFNYDRVVELAGGPSPENPSAPNTEAAVPHPYLKLHGSVDWGYDGTTVTPQADVHEGVKLDQDFALAIPGPSKASLSNRLFKPLWDRAEAAIKNADVIIFVGYRFPESDAVAKQRILGAIRADNHRITVRLVLGPQRDQHVQRVEGMLKWALGGRTVCDTKGAEAYKNTARHSTFACIIHEPMWAEDFLTVFEPNRLNAFVRG